MTSLNRGNRGSWRGTAAAIAVLILAVLLGHGLSLDDGLFFDDHWHRVTLRSAGWSFHDLVEAATFDLPGQLTHLWWQERPLQWRYARPVAMLFMKIEYLLVGGSPAGVHACGLAWHWAATLLVFALARRAGLSLAWAAWAGSLFALNPHAVFAVSWIAARNALISGCFFVAAMLAWWRSSEAGNRRAALVWFLIAVGLWGLSLFARETAVVFPVLAVVLDAVTGGWARLKRRWPAYAMLVVLTAGYLCWRLLVFPTSRAPDIYFTVGTDAAYLPWLASKFLQSLFSLVFYTPMFMGLVARQVPGGELAAVHVVMVVLLVLVGLWYWRASRGATARWFWPAWAAVGLVPVLPVFLMPHFSYLPFAGYAVGATIMVSRLRGRWRLLVAGAVLAATVWSLVVYRGVWRGIVRSEQLVYADVLSSNRRPAPGTRLFFVNLPLAAIYAPVSLREAWGVSDLEGYVLTFAPHPLAMRGPSVIEQVSDSEIVVSTPAPGYFAGPSGSMLLQGMRCGTGLPSGTVIRGERFDTTVLDGDDGGVTRLKFSFHRSVSSDEFWFFASTPERPAARLRFDGPGMKVAIPPPPNVWLEKNAAWLAARDRYFWIVEVARRILPTDLLLSANRR